MRKFKKHNENDDHKNLGNLKFKAACAEGNRRDTVCEKRGWMYQEMSA